MSMLGINCDGQYLKVALISQRGGQIQIDSLCEYKKDLFNLSEFKKKYGAERVEIASALSASDLFVRHLTLPLKNKREILKALPFQLESILPFSLEQSTTFPRLKKNKTGSDVTLYTFLNEAMVKHIDHAKALGFDPSWVSAEPLALLKFSSYFVPEKKALIHLHLGWERSSLLFVRDGVVRQNHSIKMGVKSFVDAIKTTTPSLEKLSFDFLKEMITKSIEKGDQNSLLSEVYHTFLSQIERVTASVARNEELSSYEGVLFTGYREVAELLKIEFEKSTFPEILLKREGSTKPDALASYAIEIGLALEFIDNRKRGVQLRCGAFTSENLLKKMRRKVKIALGTTGLCLALASSAMGITLFKKESALKDRFNQVVLSSGEKVESFPKMQRSFLTLANCQEEANRFLGMLKSHKKESSNFIELPGLKRVIEQIFLALSKEISLEDLTYEIKKDEALKGQAGQVSLGLLCSAKEERVVKEYQQRLLDAFKEDYILKETACFKGANGYQVEFVFQAEEVLL